MKLEYTPSKGFNLLSETFSWDEKRDVIRTKLKNQHIEDDRVIEMAEFFDGDTSHDIQQKRDIYEDINNEENYFFLNYDTEGQLIELEVHAGINILIDSIELMFHIDTTLFLKILTAAGKKYQETEDGEFFFKNLKMSISTSETMGGDGNGLGYFYAAKDVSHFID